MLKTRVRLFGGFRKYIGKETHIEIEWDGEISVADVKNLIGNTLRERFPEFADDQLIHDSALANELTVFRASDVVKAGGEIAILPPVCGG